MTLPFHSCSYLEPRFKMSSGKVSNLCRRCVIRELKQRWRQGQRERQQSNRLKLAKSNNLQQTLQVHHAFLYISLPSLHHFDVKVPNFTFCQRKWTDKTTTFLFFSWTSIQSFKIPFPEKNCQHLTKWTRWNKHDKVWGSETPIFKWRFRSCRRCRRCCLSSQFR